MNWGTRIIERYELIGDELVKRVRSRLIDVFPEEPRPNTIPDGYLWARTITCPYCDGVIPLSPNWRLAPDGTGVRVIPDESARRCNFEIVRTAKEQSQGTVAMGDARCPFASCGRVIDQEEVRRQARDGKMGEQFFTIVYKERVAARTKTGKTREKWIRGFRTPQHADDNLKDILTRLEEKIPEWKAADVLPTEVIGPQHPKYRFISRILRKNANDIDWLQSRIGGV
jgi:putative DNA methylase